MRDLANLAGNVSDSRQPKTTSGSSLTRRKPMHQVRWPSRHFSRLCDATSADWTTKAQNRGIQEHLQPAAGHEGLERHSHDIPAGHGSHHLRCQPATPALSAPELQKFPRIEGGETLLSDAASLNIRAGAREQEGSAARVPQAHEGGARVASKGEHVVRGCEDRAEAALIVHLRKQVVVMVLLNPQPSPLNPQPSNWTPLCVQGLAFHILTYSTAACQLAETRELPLNPQPLNPHPQTLNPQI
jgi:hypothetical protein